MFVSGNVEGAIPHLLHALQLDPEFPEAFELLAQAYYNADRYTDANTQWESGLRLLDRMGEWDRLRYLGDYYLLDRGEYDRAAAQYEALLQKWPDPSAEDNLAGVYALQRNMTRALETARHAALSHPKSPTYTVNVVNFELFAGDLAGTVRDGRKILKEQPRPLPAVHLYMGLAEFLSGHHKEAVEDYDAFEKARPIPGSSAKADLALAESRLAEAGAILERGIPADRAAGNVDGVELKHVMFAETFLRRGDKRRAIAEAAKVVKEPSRRFMAALVLLGAGDDRAAAATAAALGKELAIDRRVMAKILDAELARVHGKPEDAILGLQETLKLNDAWLAHFFLGRAALDAARFADAYTEFKICLGRTGEGAIAFLDDQATLRYLTPVTYYLGRAQEGLGSKEAIVSYKAFLASQSAADHDPLVEDAKRRIASVR
jgi:tetratricopeptide (TPR) repeat protein